MQELSAAEMSKVEGGFIFVLICGVILVGMVAVIGIQVGAAIGRALCN